MSRQSITTSLRLVARTLGIDDPRLIPWTQLNGIHLAQIRTLLVERGLAPATINHALAACRGVLSTAFQMGLVSADHLQRVKSVKGARPDFGIEGEGRMLESDEISRLFHICGSDVKGIRDAAILAVMCLGLRRIEVVRLDMASWADPHLTVHGKGGSRRKLHVPRTVSRYVTQYLAIRGVSEGALFVRAFKNRLSEHRLHHTSIGHILHQLQIAAGIQDFASHDMRRTAISRLLERGHDIMTIMRIVGHRDPATTARYDRRSGEQVVAALQDLI
jgi:site-specific recombinase XerC